jgi:Acyl-protein synthetase, LuxE
MTSSRPFSDFAAQLRRFIAAHSGPSSAPPSDSENECNRLALSLFALQFEYNAPYRRLCEARGISPSAIEHWSRIPAAPAVAFKEFELTSLPADARPCVFHSSGTTAQQSSRHFHDAESLSLYEASLLPWFQAHLLPDFTPHSALRIPHFLSLSPPPELAPHSSLVHMFATIHRELGSENSVFVGCVDAEAAWQVDFAQTLAVFRGAVAAGRPLIIMGTAFNFVQLADHLEANGLQFSLPPGSRVLETGGYKGRSRSLPKPNLHALITRLLGVPASHIISEYGMSELSSQAYDLSLSGSLAAAHLPGRGQGERGAHVRKEDFPLRIFHFPPWARAQTVSPETGREVADGETGLIRVFDLANLRSVLAVQTGDLGVRRGGGFELLGRAALAEARGCSLMSA